MEKRGKNRSRSKPQSQQLKVNTMSTRQQQSTSQKGSDETKKYTLLSLVIAVIAAFVCTLTLLYPILMGIINVKVGNYEKDLENLIKKGEIEINETITKAKESQRIVALISDFGVGSYYANMIKGKIIENHIHTSIIDISHEVRPFDEVEGAWILHNASQYFPDETIFWGMINPGAELKGNSIFFVTTKPRQYFIGASRTLFENVIVNQGLEVAYVPNFSKEDDKFGTTTYTELINTLLKGGTITDLQNKGLIGENITQKYKDKNGNTKTTLSTTKAIDWKDNSVSGYVCSIDRWGNLLTNIKNEESFFKKGVKYSIEVNSKKVTGFVYGDSYSDGQDKVGIIIEQDGWMQIAIYRKSANNYFGLDKSGNKIVICKEN